MYALIPHAIPIVVATKTLWGTDPTTNSGSDSEEEIALGGGGGGGGNDVSSSFSLSDCNITMSFSCCVSCSSIQQLPYCGGFLVDVRK